MFTKVKISANDYYIRRDADGASIPNDTRNADYSRFLEWEIAGNITPVVDLTIPTLEDYAAAVEKHVDDTARTKQYSGALSLASYRDDPNPYFAAEAAAFINWRSRTWETAIQIQNEVVSGLRLPPTIEQLISELPIIEWPT